MMELLAYLKQFGLIKLTNNSGLDQLDWDNLPFGKVFSDHMFSMRYENGEWHNL